MTAVLSWLKSGAPPHYVYLVVGALLLVEYVLPRVQRPAARSILELVADLLRLVPGVGPIVARFGSPPPAAIASVVEVQPPPSSPAIPPNSVGKIAAIFFASSLVFSGSALAAEDGGVAVDGGAPVAISAVADGGAKPEAPPLSALDPRRAIQMGAQSAVATDCAKCIGGVVPFFKTRNGGYAILGIAFGGVAQIVVNFVIPYVLPPPPALDQSKP